jgi:hypothetical protein
MPKVSPERWAEPEGFWRDHHEAWKCSTLNQREYCELHGLPLKRFGNWRDRFKAEEEVRQAGLLSRRGGLSHMSSHMTGRENGPVSTGYIPSGRSLPEARRNFRLTDKRRIVAEAMAPGASVSGVARRYGIAPRVLFRWKQELAPPPPEPVFLAVAVNDGAGEQSMPPWRDRLRPRRSHHGRGHCLADAKIRLSVRSMEAIMGDSDDPAAALEAALNSATA